MTPVALREKYGEWVETAVDLRDLPLLQGMNCTWYAQATSLGAKGKFHVMTKIWETKECRSRTLYLHRAILGEPRLQNDRAALEIRHAERT